MPTGKLKTKAAEPRPAIATDVKFNRQNFTVILVDGREISIPLSFYPTLAKATPSQRASWELIGQGRAICWEALDLDLSVQFLLEGAREGVPKPLGAAGLKVKRPA